MVEGRAGEPTAGRTVLSEIHGLTNEETPFTPNARTNTKTAHKPKYVNGAQQQNGNAAPLTADKTNEIK